MNEELPSLQEIADYLVWESYPSGAEVIRNAVASLDASHAIVMRVYREMGPAHGAIGIREWFCESCRRYGATENEIPHRHDCLWKSAETLLRKEGLI
jgi:hypothetical protein